MKKIPCNVQSLLRASNQITNHKKAVEELVYNALDAGATSIAIRINIQENTIQVIDNGCGISSKDYNVIGHKYMTSKFFDLSTLRSAPNKYGFRGQALANIINISKSVKVVSRHEHSEETWMKLYECGVEKLIDRSSIRPSKGTTVEIIGFLYNLCIQKKAKDILGDLQSIKIFLDHISLIHCNVSLSLRDDSKNEIIFKMHKNRDIYQTLSSLYQKDRNNLQELLVEKSEYKVTAYLDKSEGTGKKMMFVNGKLIKPTSKLHKIVNNSLSKHFEIKMRGSQKSKLTNMNIDEENWIKKKKPDYFIFIKCPYMDYDLSNSQSVLEFRDWDQINKLLEKLIKFFYGEINLRQEYRVNKNQADNKDECSDTRKQVQKIVEKILGTHSKKPGISHMHNAIKGKRARRKKKKLVIKSTNQESNHKENCNGNAKPTNNMVSINKYCHSNKTKESGTNKMSVSKITVKSNLGTNIVRKYNSQVRKPSKKIKMNNTKNKNVDIRKNKKFTVDKGMNLKKFEKKTDYIKKKVDESEQSTRSIINQIYKNSSYMLVNDHIEMKNNMPKRQVNMSVHKQIDEMILHNNTANSSTSKLINKNNVYKHVKKKLIQSNYDLLQTILETQQEKKAQIKNVPNTFCNAIAMSSSKGARIDDFNKSINLRSQNSFSEETITFKSHNYYTQQRYNTENDIVHSHDHIRDKRRSSFYAKPGNFIKKQSRDNFVISNKAIKSNHFKKKNVRTYFSKQFQSHIKHLLKETSILFNLKKQIMGHTSDSSNMIEVLKSNSYRLTNNKDVTANATKNNKMTIEDRLPHSDTIRDKLSINTGTYSILNVDKHGFTINDDENWAFHSTYTIKRANKLVNNTDEQNQGNKDTGNSQNKKNFIFVSKSQKYTQNEQIMNPINLCEVILEGQDLLEREFAMSFDDNQKNLTKNHYFQGDYNDSPYRIYSNENEVIWNQNIKVQDNAVSNNDIETTKSSPILTSRLLTIENQIIHDKNISKIINESNVQGFSFMNRLCFLPKGMSPIFQNCQTKNVCEYVISKDYYEKEMYNNFADDVRNQAEIFESKIQDTKEMTTKTIHKVNVKITKDSSELKFNGQSLKDAKILGQIDEKFIATIMMKDYNMTSTDFLVLFDQHAVHERIRLENSLADYFNENQWKPVKIDPVSLMLSGHDIPYVHNFKDKFEQLGLQWTIINDNEISIQAIPEAILGKNPRQVEKVIKSVNNLITEEISIMKIQGGCISLYPKSIMNLVFSEACRYAIKFGDRLSKIECVDLLKKLSDCKIPFQCAHGRPVMAVLMETKLNKVDYKINLDQVIEWKRKH